MVETAREAVADNFQAEATRRAYEGSDTLLAFLLRGLKPEIYGNRKYTHPRPQSKKTIRSSLQLADILGPVTGPDE